MEINAAALAEGDLSWDSLVDRLEAYYLALIASVRQERALAR